jgi:hypothetical protein
MVNVVIRTGVGFHVDTETQTALEIFYQSIRIVSNEQTELSDNVCYMDFHVMCLTETLLNDICFNYHSIIIISIISSTISTFLTTFRSHTVSSTKCSAAVLQQFCLQLVTLTPL